MSTTDTPWKVSLHGGHSGEFCNHAVGSLREVVEAAVAKGYKTYGISEHVPRHGEQYLYPDELEKGWTLEKIIADFEAYGRAIFEVAEEFRDRITILRGFEIEVVPHDRYAQIMLDYRAKFRFDYMIGSVHYLHDTSIDSSVEEFETAMHRCGGLDELCIHYYETVAQMIPALKPEVVGHLDLVRKNGHLFGALDTPAIRKAAEGALEVARDHRCILDLNTAGWRKGLDSPYPAPWLLKRANEMGVPFCFGDDSHGPEMVGAGVEEARKYLLENGVTTVTVLNRNGNEITRKVVPLQ